MKLLSLFVLFFVTRLAVAQNNTAFSLAGTISGLNDSSSRYIYLGYHDTGDQYITDSTLIVNGTFKFSGKVKYVAIANLFLKHMPKGRRYECRVFLEPKPMAVTVNAAAFGKATVTGSETQNDFNRVEAQKALIAQKYQKQIDSLNAEKDDYKRGLIHERLEPYLREYNRAEIDFIAKAPKSFLAALFLGVHVRDMSIDSVQKYYEGLSGSARGSSVGREIRKALDIRRAAIAGKPAFMFVSKDINGAGLKLADYSGKYVLLDFWASWCVPCRQGNPHLKKLYAAYKNKGIEFIGVAADVKSKSIPAWHNAVKADGLTWRHVLNIDNNQVDINKEYAVAFLPTKVLIDPQGIIVGRYTNDKELDDKLAALLK